MGAEPQDLTALRAAATQRLQGDEVSRRRTLRPDLDDKALLACSPTVHLRTKVFSNI